MQRIESCRLFGVGPAPVTRADLSDAVAEYQLAKWRRSRRTSTNLGPRRDVQPPIQGEASIKLLAQLVRACWPDQREMRPLRSRPPKLGSREVRGGGAITYLGPPC